MIAENKEVYSKIFLRHQIESALYALQFFKDGKPQVVIIDDYILTKNEVPLTMEDSDFSVYLIEKAYAKLYGTY